jgi:hypothetical protein
MREPGDPQEDAKEAVEILSMLRWLYEAEVPVGSELADDALDDVAHALWKSGLLDILITRAANLFRPHTR